MIAIAAATPPSINTTTAAMIPAISPVFFFLAGAASAGAAFSIGLSSGARESTLIVLVTGAVGCADVCVGVVPGVEFAIGVGATGLGAGFGAGLGVALGIGFGAGPATGVGLRGFGVSPGFSFIKNSFKIITLTPILNFPENVGTVRFRHFGKLSLVRIVEF